KGAFELVLWRVDGFGPDPISYLPVFMSNGAKHYYLNTPPGQEDPLVFEPQINRLMRSQQEKTLANERKPDFNKVQQVWAENNPTIYIAADHVLIGANKQLGNFQPVPMQPYATWNSDLLYFKR